MKILVTGGAGYIGSTICSALIDCGYTPIILDSLYAGKKEFTKNRFFYQGDIADRILLKKIFLEHPDIETCVHCAARIIVPESTIHPFEYYSENVAKSNVLFHELASLGCKKIIFSSSASIYAPVTSDKENQFMVDEAAAIDPQSPYARTKMMMELVLQDFCQAYGMRSISLRYFNPIGADPQMRSGPYVKNPTHVLGRLVDTALGKISQFQITGTNWPTRDGTGIRDYIHVWDLALAHVKAIEQFECAFQRSGKKSSSLAINLGSGHGVTVLELVAAFEAAWGGPLSKSFTDPRPGDVAGCYASAEFAQQLIGWKVELTTEQAIRDALHWAKTTE